MPDQPGRFSRRFLIVILLVFASSGCDIVQQKLGLADPAKAAHDIADGKAVGGACRQSGRAIEDCYSIYSWLPRASIYEGWRDMDVYMRDNNLVTIAPQLPPPQPPPPPPPPVSKKKKKAASATEDADAAAATEGASGEKVKEKDSTEKK